MSAIERAYSMWCDGRFALPNDEDINALEKMHLRSVSYSLS